MGKWCPLGLSKREFLSDNFFLPRNTPLQPVWNRWVGEYKNIKQINNPINYPVTYLYFLFVCSLYFYLTLKKIYELICLVFQLDYKLEDRTVLCLPLIFNSF